mmetsp:Transcript_95236/g.273032  ORF Transcript_95236/g.273032 Transcript_95236/m.273032 type:complete len:83 (-) Transcript_95236:610-858(-)
MALPLAWRGIEVVEAFSDLVALESGVLEADCGVPGRDRNEVLPRGLSEDLRRISVTRLEEARSLEAARSSAASARLSASLLR